MTLSHSVSLYNLYIMHDSCTTIRVPPVGTTVHCAHASASASAKILDTPRLGITSRHTMVRVVHDKMLCQYMYSAG